MDEFDIHRLAQIALRLPELDRLGGVEGIGREMVPRVGKVVRMQAVEEFVNASCLPDNLNDISGFLILSACGCIGGKTGVEPLQRLSLAIVPSQRHGTLIVTHSLSRCNSDEGNLCDKGK